MIDINEDEFVKVCEESVSMAVACEKLDMKFTTFKRKAQKLGCYKTNQGLNGGSRPKSYKYPIEDIFSNKYSSQSNMLRKRLFKEGYKEERCECCGLVEWLGDKIPLELHHKDGDNSNNNLDNLEILCPNCHTRTDTYKGKNIKKDAPMVKG
jgi:hypothetical protein